MTTRIETREAAPGAQRPPTRERLIGAALELFAERGYRGTSVGEIETAAGLVPRSGALYKHFDSKRALLGAALAERIVALDRIDERIDLLPAESGGDLETELTLIARIALSELEGERELARIVMKEGDRFPEVADDFHQALVARGREIAIVWLGARARAHGLELADSEASAEVIVDALVGRTLKSFMLGDRLRVVERDRFIAAWVDLAGRLLKPDHGGPTDDS